VSALSVESDATLLGYDLLPVLSTGIEPVPPPSEGDILSIKLRELSHGYLTINA
jgi:hypothetical protein